jgi:hypothetical protein
MSASEATDGEFTATLVFMGVLLKNKICLSIYQADCAGSLQKNALFLPKSDMDAA